MKLVQLSSNEIDLILTALSELQQSCGDSLSVFEHDNDEKKELLKIELLKEKLNEVKNGK